MNSEQIIIRAISYEKKIRDLYASACSIIDDEKGKQIFKSLADDEQSHVEFLEHSFDELNQDGDIDLTKLETPVPSKDAIEQQIKSMVEKIPERMLGDVKRVLNSALQLELETSAFYLDALKKSEGKLKEVFQKFYEIEQRHVEVVQMELDYASNNGFWFNFMEIDMEY